MKDNIIKKIDSLGRIVIPKDLRKKLNIKSDDDLEIILENEVLHIKKFYKIDNYFYKISKYIYFLEKTLNIKIYITDKEKIIYPIIENNKLLHSYINLINDRKDIKQKDFNLIKVSEELIISNYIYISPLIIDSNLIGSIIYCSENKKIEFKEIITILKIFTEFIKIELEN
jgi:AbrB family transcriptional regulator, stage V sporulation protein T